MSMFNKPICSLHMLTHIMIWWGTFSNVSIREHYFGPNTCKTVYFQHRWIPLLQKWSCELFSESTVGDWFNKTRVFKIPNCLQHMDHIAPESTCGDWLHKTRAFRSSWTCYHLALLIWGSLVFIFSGHLDSHCFLVTKKIIAG